MYTHLDEDNTASEACAVSFHKEYTFLDRDNTRQVFIFHKMAYTLLDGDNATTVSEFQFNVDTLSSERMALTYFLRGGCAVYLVLKKINPICTRNSKCARRWRNPTCAKRAKLRHLPHF